MKILYLCADLGIPVLGRKGASVHVREMTGAMARAGHEVTIVAQTLTKAPWEKRAELAVPIIQVRRGPALSAAVQAFKEFNEPLKSESGFPGELRRILYNQQLVDDVRRRFENVPPDFIYERASIYGIAGVALAELFQVPLLLELNAPLAAEQSAYRATGFEGLAAQAEKWLLKKADAVLAVSNELKKHVLAAGVPARRIHVIPNPVNVDLFRPGKAESSVREGLNLNGVPVLGFVGGLRPWHGVESLPKLINELRKDHPAAQLLIAGDGPLRKQVETQFRTRGLKRHVTFTGALRHEEIPAVIRQFDIAVAPYPNLDHEFYFSPLKIFEYMACGVPVVAPKLGQIAEVVT